MTHRNTAAAANSNNGLWHDSSTPSLPLPPHYYYGHHHPPPPPPPPPHHHFHHHHHQPPPPPPPHHLPPHEWMLPPHIKHWQEGYFAAVQQQERLTMTQIGLQFMAKLVLEVFGGAGAIWGFSEVVGLRKPDTLYIWRPTALAFGIIFFGRWIWQLFQVWRPAAAAEKDNRTLQHPGTTASLGRSQEGDVESVPLAVSLSLSQDSADGSTNSAAPNNTPPASTLFIPTPTSSSTTASLRPREDPEGCTPCKQRWVNTASDESMVLTAVEEGNTPQQQSQPPPYRLRRSPTPTTAAGASSSTSTTMPVVEELEEEPLKQK